MTQPAKHTPGPWNARRNHAETTESERINITAGSVLIAETHHAWIDWEEQEANAHLIAAAPTMYADLCAVRDYLFELYDEGNAKAGEYAASLGITIEQAEGAGHE